MRLFGYKMTWVAQLGLLIVVLNLFVAVFAPLIVYLALFCLSL